MLGQGKQGVAGQQREEPKSRDPFEELLEHFSRNPAVQKRAPTSETQAVLTGMRIVIVDDNPIKLVVEHAWLAEATGLDVGVVQFQGQEKEVLVADIVTRAPDCIILRNFLSLSVTGCDLVGPLREALPDAVIIGQCTQDFVEARLREAGVHGFVATPIVGNEALKEVANVITKCKSPLDDNRQKSQFGEGESFVWPAVVSTKREPVVSQKERFLEFTKGIPALERLAREIQRIGIDSEVKTTLAGKRIVMVDNHPGSLACIEPWLNAATENCADVVLHCGQDDSTLAADITETKPDFIILSDRLISGRVAWVISDKMVAALKAELPGTVIIGCSTSGVHEDAFAKMGVHCTVSKAITPEMLLRKIADVVA